MLGNFQPVQHQEPKRQPESETFLSHYHPVRLYLSTNVAAQLPIGTRSQALSARVTLSSSQRYPSSLRLSPQAGHGTRLPSGRDR